ncbi:hypothetical protein B0H19DRAFT_968839 [Mycena capillaripes]|nr:hypothetical protein B0H19DRAFT_968839 [Mycena capillaripes]
MDSVRSSANLSLVSRSYGHAAATAYIAYKDQQFLKYAVQSWWFGRSRTISDNDDSLGHRYWVCPNTLTFVHVAHIIVTDTSWCECLSGMPSHLVTPAARLSALLAEATSDPMYLQAAVESADFIRSQLYSIGNTVQQYIFADAKDICQTSSAVDPAVPLVLARDPTNSGLMIEGLSILYSITNNASTQNS